MPISIRFERFPVFHASGSAGGRPEFDISGNKQTGKNKKASQKENQIGKVRLKLDNVHMLVSISPKYWVSQVAGFFRGRNAIQSARLFFARDGVLQGNIPGPEVCSQIGMTEETIREYIEAHKKEDRQLDQMNLFQK